MMQYDATVLYEDFLKTLHEWKSRPLKSFIQSLGFNYNKVSQETDTHAVIVDGDITYIFYAENDTAALNIINTVDHRCIDYIHFKWKNGEWNETD